MASNLKQANECWLFNRFDSFVAIGIRQEFGIERRNVDTNLGLCYRAIIGRFLSFLGFAGDFASI